MRSYPVRFSRNRVTVLVLLAVPLLAAFLFIAPLLIIPGTQDAIVMAVIVIMMITAIVSVRFIIKKWATVDAEVDMDAVGITIRLKESSLLYPRTRYAASWDALENVSSHIDPRLKQQFYLIRFRRPAVTLSLTPAADPDDANGFGETLRRFVSQHNARHAGSPIGQQGFYDAWWAKGLTLLCYLMAVIVLVMRFATPERISNWHVAQMTAISALWLWVYYSNRRKRAG